MKHLLAVVVFGAVIVGAGVIIYHALPAANASSLSALVLNNFSSVFSRKFKPPAPDVITTSTPTSTTTSTPYRRRAVTPPSAPVSTSTRPK